MKTQKTDEAQKSNNRKDFVQRSSLYQEFLAEREEILRHKWIESEKLGYDIGFERALLDWIRNHRDKWRSSRRVSGNKAAEKKLSWNTKRQSQFYLQNWLRPEFNPGGTILWSLCVMCGVWETCYTLTFQPSLVALSCCEWSCSASLACFLHVLRYTRWWLFLSA